MQDRIEWLSRSMIQHGPLNRRIYVMKLNRDDLPAILGKLDSMALDRDYEKILVKAPVSSKGLFEEDGYVQEAYIPGFFKGKESLVFMSKFLATDRMLDNRIHQYRTMMSIVRQKAIGSRTSVAARDPEVVRCGPGDAAEISRLYREVFQSYPFPIYDPHFLQENMTSHVDYFSIRVKDQMRAVAASEKERENLSVEMTDFATLPAWQGRGLACRLLSTMELNMAEQGMITAFSIARALSYGMNITFGKLGYTYGGLLTNNTNIAGCIESMTVWYKRLNEIL
jgi:putative beta-lysine N-acetyltransferase